MFAELKFNDVGGFFKYQAPCQEAWAIVRLCREIEEHYDLEGAKSFWLCAGNKPPKDRNVAVYKLSKYRRDPFAVYIHHTSRSVMRLGTTAGEWLRKQVNKGATHVWIELE